MNNYNIIIVNPNMVIGQHLYKILSHDTIVHNIMLNALQKKLQENNWNYIKITSTGKIKGNHWNNNLLHVHIYDNYNNYYGFTASITINKLKTISKIINPKYPRFSCNPLKKSERLSYNYSWDINLCIKCLEIYFIDM